ncbi:SMI1/KNR4 family protein [Paraburkholderia sp. J67]|uniref:SMI1/KNR4 family protein n=1 Tax=Paraburkholderia sp. J67 TaxID=2805435 RepID=UPI002ABDD207|nr:SMI1/KNR4 family protein [Paraburkholderia sp. J67]
MQNEFVNCGPAIDRADIEKIERDFGFQLPEPMKAHYLKWNGGMPTLDWFPMEDDWEPIWVHEFLPVGTQENDKPTIQSVYAQVAGKAGYPHTFVPFAVDPGGNLFCIDTATGVVHYWLADVFDTTRTDSENRQKADRALTRSFDRFVSALVSEDDAFS